VLLSGIVLSSFAGALVTFLLVASDRLALRLRAVLGWLLGGISVIDLTELAVAAAIVAVGLLLALLLSPRVDAFAFGDETAATLGVEVVEVHVTMSRGMFGPDVVASITMEELRQLVDGIRYAHISPRIGIYKVPCLAYHHAPPAARLRTLAIFSLLEYVTLGFAKALLHGGSKWPRRKA